jgi:hypothetical protein
MDLVLQLHGHNGPNYRSNIIWLDLVKYGWIYLDSMIVVVATYRLLNGRYFLIPFRLSDEGPFLFKSDLLETWSIGTICSTRCGVRRNDSSHRLSVHAQCGGAATFMRAIVAQPTQFANSHHFMNNCVTGTWEPVRVFSDFNRIAVAGL